MEYQVKALKEITDQCRGTLFDYDNEPQILAMLYMNLFRATLWALAFKRGGSFHTMIGRNDSIDLQTDFAEALADIKTAYMEKELILDDEADNPYYVTYENGTWAHVEVVFQYDPRNRAQIENMKNVALDNLIAALDRCSEPMFSYEPKFRKIAGPVSSNFSYWQSRISEKLDPNASADTGRYLREEDFDFSGIPQEKVDRLMSLFEKFKWVDGHPPAE